MDLGYSLWETGIKWFENAPGGVNRWSVGAFLVVAAGLSLMARGMVGGGFTGAPGQVWRFALGVVSFIIGIGGFFGFLFIAMGAFELPPLGKEAMACLLLAGLGLAGVITVMSKERPRA